MMFDDTIDLAENKLMLLYIFESIKFPISNNQITEIVLENNLMNYFILQQYISELVTAGFVEHSAKDGKPRLIITEKGHKVLGLFKSRISEDKIEGIDAYLTKHSQNIKKEVTITADYTILNESNYIVDLIAKENDTIMIDVKLNVPSNKQARELCRKWKLNSSELYKKIIELLINN